MNWDSYQLGEELTDETARLEAEWHEKRSGRITCSMFGVLIGQGQSGEQFTKKGFGYLRLKVAEALGSRAASFSSAATSWGKEHEQSAIDEYREKTGSEVTSSPFLFFKIPGNIGGTPDGLVGERGCLEIKCPYDPAVHINTMLTRRIPAEYFWQVVGHCLVTGRGWCDFVSFDPRIDGPERMVCIRWKRAEEGEDPHIKKLSERLSEANGWVSEQLEEIRNQYR